ncbi:MAG: hypothetical protein LBT40_16290 [Deltaproteobacteria bacterium]|nr:hypothetical protein [Deltaproteobacteria bacterium]
MVLGSLLFVAALAFFMPCRDCRADDLKAGGREDAPAAAVAPWHGKDIYQKLLAKAYASVMLGIICGLDPDDAEGVVHLDTEIVRGDWKIRRTDWLCQTLDRVCRIT